MTPEQKVIAWASTMLGQPFEWGRTDCALVALEGLEQLTGEAYAAAYRGAWSTEAEALAHFQKETPSGVLQSFGAVEHPPTFAVLGDVITVPADPWPEQLHFVLGRHSFTSDQKRGVTLVPTRTLRALPGARLWRVAPCLKPSP